MLESMKHLLNTYQPNFGNAKYKNWLLLLGHRVSCNTRKIRYRTHAWCMCICNTQIGLVVVTSICNFISCILHLKYFEIDSTRGKLTFQLKPLNLLSVECWNAGTWFDFFFLREFCLVGFLFFVFVCLRNHL